MANFWSHPNDPRKTIYHIRVQGSLDPQWADWFEGFVVISRGDGETLLSGPVTDQAALYGVLAKINSLGLPLLLVAQVDCPCQCLGCAKRGQCAACLSYETGRKALPACMRRNSRLDKHWREMK